LHDTDFDYPGFEWIDFHDSDHSVVAFLRKGKSPGDYLVIVCNFTPEVHHGYRVGVPDSCFHREILNTDDLRFGGSGHALPYRWQNQPYHVELTLPPLGVVYLKPER
jgi:1,4-alpha-glucan branching enzyme